MFLERVILNVQIFPTIAISESNMKVHVLEQRWCCYQNISMILAHKPQSFTLIRYIVMSLWLLNLACFLFFVKIVNWNLVPHEFVLEGLFPTETHQELQRFVTSTDFASSLCVPFANWVSYDHISLGNLMGKSSLHWTWRINYRKVLLVEDGTFVKH